MPRTREPRRHGIPYEDFLQLRTAAAAKVDDELMRRRAAEDEEVKPPWGDILRGWTVSIRSLVSIAFSCGLFISYLGPIFTDMTVLDLMPLEGVIITTIVAVAGYKILTRLDVRDSVVRSKFLAFSFGAATVVGGSLTAEYKIQKSHFGLSFFPFYFAAPICLSVWSSLCWMSSKSNPSTSAIRALGFATPFWFISLPLTNIPLSGTYAFDLGILNFTCAITVHVAWMLLNKRKETKREFVEGGVDIASAFLVSSVVLMFVKPTENPGLALVQLWNCFGTVVGAWYTVIWIRKQKTTWDILYGMTGFLGMLFVMRILLEDVTRPSLAKFARQLVRSVNITRTYSDM